MLNRLGVCLYGLMNAASLRGWRFPAWARSWAARQVLLSEGFDPDAPCPSVGERGVW